RRHLDAAMHGEEVLIALERAGEIGAQAHEGMKPRLRERLCQELRETAALPLLGAHIELLALIDIKEEGGGLGLGKLRIAALGRVEEVAEMRLALEQELHPTA